MLSSANRPETETEMAGAVKPASSIPLRRSKRVQVRIPATLSGNGLDGNTFSEETYVLSVSKFGARMKAMNPLKVGDEVTVKPRNSRQSALYRVVWVGSEGTPRAGEIGVEYVSPANLLGITFPD